MHEVRFQDGEVIFSEGDRGEHCYRIVSGKVEIFLDRHGLLRRGQRETLAHCGPGEFVGEMSLIAGGPRSASAVAVGPTVCTAYTAAEVMETLERDPQEAMAYVRLLIQRLRHSNRKTIRPGAHRG